LQKKDRKIKFHADRQSQGFPHYYYSILTMHKHRPIDRVDATMVPSTRSWGKNTGSDQNVYQDLESTLLDWKNKNYEILMMIDANETVGEKPGGITMILGKVGLIDLTSSKHPNGTPPNTHSRGSKKIDYMFGSIRVKEFCTRAGITPFGLGYQSDHRTLFIILDIEQILQTDMCNEILNGSNVSFPFESINILLSCPIMIRGK
jgi:hypothetical protein